MDITERSFMLITVLGVKELTAQEQKRSVNKKKTRVE